MAIIVTKTAEGTSAVTAGTLTAEEHEILFLVTGTANRSEAFEAVEREAPEKIDHLVRRRYRFERYTGSTMEITAVYEQAEDPLEPGDAAVSGLTTQKARISFDTSGGTQHITTSKERPTGYSSDPKKPPVKNPGFSIGWNGKSGKDAEYAGVDIIVPNVRKVVVQTIPRPNTAYENLVIDMTGTVNADKFLGREPGEVLLLGVSWDDNGDEPVTATYNFAIRKNENTNVHGIEIVKKGWEYVWDIIKTKKETEASDVEVTVEGIFVSRVYTETTFKKLGIRV